ncbi:MAG: alpha/beta hydrolase [Anaerolineales bacterium]
MNFLSLLFIVVTSVLVGWLYYRDRQRAIGMLQAQSQIAQTPRGPIEYASVGEGTPLLVVHGWGGGGPGEYNLFHFLAEHGFRVISVSRPGYLGTPLSVGVTMEEQADAFAALLDALDIPRTAIVTGSGGAPASILFALRHPARCWGLVLVCALTKPDPITGKTPAQKTLEKVFYNDFLMWVISKLLWRPLVEGGMGGLNEAIRQNPQKMDELKKLITGLMLGSLSKDGLKNDMIQWERMPVYPLEQIQVPTLIFNSRNDQSIPWHVAEFTATIPHAKKVYFEDGGHPCFIVYDEVTHPETIAFLNAHKPTI